MKEALIQNAIASEYALNAIVEKYNLPKDDVFDLFLNVYMENMQYQPKYGKPENHNTK